MEADQCSVGKHDNEECHKTSYGNLCKEIKHINEYNEERQKLFKLRVFDNVSTICKYHEKKYLHKYHHLFGQMCSDPCKSHKKPVTRGLREIQLEHLSKVTNFSVNLVPGKSLCANCYSRIFVLNKRDTETDDTAYYPHEETVEKLDSVCTNLGLSPASKIRKLTTDKRQSALKLKVDKVSTSVRKNLEACFQKNMTDTKETEHQSLANEYEELIEKLKQKCAVASKEDKIKVLSLLPSSWPRRKIASEFNVSDRLVKVTKELVRNQGILPEIGKRNRKGVTDDIIKKVIEFYQNDECSRMCPGKKDYVSVVIDGTKVQKQKYLVLNNLNELFVAFKNAHPECKIGRSKFCELRPKWCVLAGGPGTHTVCVCPYHQNVKLMIDGARLNVDYKDLLARLVCNVNSYNCMMNICEECPGKKLLFDMLMETKEDSVMPDNIVYKQWITTDRAEMVTNIKPIEEFFETLAEKLESLKVHHYVSKAQSQFLKEQKENLTDSECIVISDFAENFTCVIQDEIQGYHWVNEQATVHPFVYYFKQGDEIKSNCVCILSDHMEHNTAVVHAFQIHLINHIKEFHPSVDKIIYFSDGSSSQYKNKKNFFNICRHKADFGLNAEWNFFGTSHGKNACDGVGGTTKREVTKASLQRTTTQQILNVQDMYLFCKEKIKGITYILVQTGEIQQHAVKLKERFEQCQKIPGTRKFHRFQPINENTVRCYLTSKSVEFEEHQVTKVVPLTLQHRDTVACIYEGQWWLGEVENISLENMDVLVKFYHPAGPRTSFKMSAADRVWVPVRNVLRKISALELTTATGRSHVISEKLCNEISQLLNKHRD